MIYAKRILSILLVLCLLGNTAITVFANDADSGGDELPPVDAATEEPALEDEETPSSEELPDEDATLPETTAPPEGADTEETTDPRAGMPPDT